MLLVDTVDVEPERVEEYLGVVGTLGLAVMHSAGASFVSCATTSSEIGEPVCIEVTWSFDDHVHWDEIRKNLVLDPRYHEYGALLSSLRVGDAPVLHPHAPFVRAVMLRRFEVYALRPDAPAPAVRALEAACRQCGRFIPEVIDCAVGTNLSDAPVQLVWEHAYESPEAYRRYMVHPYHAVVIDRYLLPDAPARIVIDGPLGAGLYGYSCDAPSYRMSAGVRRLVLLRLDTAAPQTDVARMAETLGRAPTDVAEMSVSIMAANSMGSAWFDGVTPVMGPPRWTHLWEQGFSSLDALDAYRYGDSTWAAVERAGWDGWMDGIVRRSAELFYEVSSGPGPEGA